MDDVKTEMTPTRRLIIEVMDLLIQEVTELKDGVATFNPQDGSETPTTLSYLEGLKDGSREAFAGVIRMVELRKKLIEGHKRADDH